MSKHHTEDYKLSAVKYYLDNELIKNKGGLMQKFAIDNKDNICLSMDSKF